MAALLVLARNLPGKYYAFFKTSVCPQIACEFALSRRTETLSILTSLLQTLKLLARKKKVPVCYNNVIIELMYMFFHLKFLKEFWRAELEL